jgi:hypothetical protein
MGKSRISTSSLVLNEEGVAGEQGEVCVLPLCSLVWCSSGATVGKVGGNGDGGKPPLCARHEYGHKAMARWGGDKRSVLVLECALACTHVALVSRGGRGTG